MEKYVYLTIGLLTVSVVATADCVGGTWVTANSVANNPDICTEATCNGATFCKSSGTMNWWSAFTWCASNGLHLATFQEMCPGISTSAPATCFNLQGVGGDQWVWSALGKGDRDAFHVNLSTGKIDGGKSRAAGAFGLCK